jgi:hypothetical protein
LNFIKLTVQKRQDFQPNYAPTHLLIRKTHRFSFGMYEETLKAMKELFSSKESGCKTAKLYFHISEFYFAECYLRLKEVACYKLDPCL